MKKLKYNRLLASKWYVYFVALLISFMTMNFLSFMVIERSVVEREIEFSMNNERDIVKTKKIIMDKNIENILQDIRFLVNELEDYKAMEDGEFSNKSLQTVMDYAYSDKEPKEIYVYDKYFHNKLHLKYNEGNVKMDVKYHEESELYFLKKHKNVIVKVERNGSVGDGYLKIIVPIMKKNEVDGAVEFKYDFADIGKELENFTTEEQGFWFILTSEGEVILKDKNIDEKLEIFDANIVKDNWEAIVAEKYGQFVSRKGMISFDTLEVESKWGLREIEEDNETWKIILFDPLTRYNLNYLSKEGFQYTISQYLRTQKFSIITVFLLTCSIIAFLVMKEKNRIRMEEMASKDLMTDTYNRAKGMLMLENTFSKEKILSLAFIDINGLKLVNDNLGHEKGDELLIETVRYLKKYLRKNDYVIRLGGDEFLVIFPETSQVHSMEILEKTLEDIEMENTHSDYEYNISFSYGVATRKYGSEKNLSDLIDEADKKMYIKKKEMKKKVKILKI